MPRYDFACNDSDCATRFESFKRVVAEPPPCPTCVGPTRVVILQAPAGKVQSDWAGEMARAKKVHRGEVVQPGMSYQEAVASGQAEAVERSRGGGDLGPQTLHSGMAMKTEPVKVTEYGPDGATTRTIAPKKRAK
jgi:hypothetical protein